MHGSLLWRHNGRDGVSNHQPHNHLLNHSLRRRSNKTSKFRVTGLSAGNSLVTGEFLPQMASYAEKVSVWWRHHVIHSMFAMQIGFVFLPWQMYWVYVKMNCHNWTLTILVRIVTSSVTPQYCDNSICVFQWFTAQKEQKYLKHRINITSR